MSIHRYISLYPHTALFFFFNDTATTEIYTLSLHDALPISASRSKRTRQDPLRIARVAFTNFLATQRSMVRRSQCARSWRSEEHTSELQSHSDLVCRLLLVKKKQVIAFADPSSVEHMNTGTR